MKSRHIKHDIGDTHTHSEYECEFMKFKLLTKLKRIEKSKIRNLTNFWY